LRKRTYPRLRILLAGPQDHQRRVRKCRVSKGNKSPTNMNDPRSLKKSCSNAKMKGKRAGGRERGGPKLVLSEKKISRPEPIGPQMPVAPKRGTPAPGAIEKGEVRSGPPGWRESKM